MFKFQTDTSEVDQQVMSWFRLADTKKNSFRHSFCYLAMNNINGSHSRAWPRTYCIWNSRNCIFCLEFYCEHHHVFLVPIFGNLTSNCLFNISDPLQTNKAISETSTEHIPVSSLFYLLCFLLLLLTGKCSVCLS